MIDTAEGAPNCHRSVLTAEDGQQILVDSWRPAADIDVRAIIQIFHGLGEHPARYERFAGLCIRQGFAVVAHAHRGHGENCDEQNLGHYTDQDGWNKVIGDALLVQEDILTRFAGLPLVLLGHSMGSYIAQSFMMRHGGDVQALILSASTYASRLQLRIGHLLAAFEVWRSGPRAKSSLLNRMGFADFNQRFAPSRTEFDWLSRDENEVDKYIADPLCGALSSNKLWHDLTAGLLEITSRRSLSRIPAHLPILITGGEQDPVGGAKGLGRLTRAYGETGHSDVSLRVYDGARHEMLNETNRDEFSNDVLNWISDKL